MRHINIQSTGSGSADIAEAIYKLVKISGAIETLYMGDTGLAKFFTEDFYKALGENKTLKLIDMSTTSKPEAKKQKLLAKAIGMNGYRRGALESIFLRKWFGNKSELFNFVESLLVSNKEHEEWYGDKKVAAEMEKEDLVGHMYCKLSNFDIGESTIRNFDVNYK